MGLSEWTASEEIKFESSLLLNEVPVMQFIDESCIVFDDEEENKLECIWLTAMLIFFYQRKQTGTYDQGVEERTGHEERTGQRFPIQTVIMNIGITLWFDLYSK